MRSLLSAEPGLQPSDCVGTDVAAPGDLLTCHPVGGPYQCAWACNTLRSDNDDEPDISSKRFRSSSDMAGETAVNADTPPTLRHPTPPVYFRAVPMEPPVEYEQLNR